MKAALTLQAIMLSFSVEFLLVPTRYALQRCIRAILAGKRSRGRGQYSNNKTPKLRQKIYIIMSKYFLRLQSHKFAIYKTNLEECFFCQGTTSLHFARLAKPHHTTDAAACRVDYYDFSG